MSDIIERAEAWRDQGLGSDPVPELIAELKAARDKPPFPSTHNHRKERMKIDRMTIELENVEDIFDGAGAHTLLMQYSEWLDVEKINPSTPEAVDGKTHTDLVDAFLAQRNPDARPMLS